jgi:hypothetical protein
VNKNCPNDCKVSCKSLSSLLKLIGIDEDLEKEFEQFVKKNIPKKNIQIFEI